VALTDEQRAMLQLLLEGGQSYEDIGSLLGITAEEVRSRARAALTEIGGADPDAQVPISDYLLGHADPIGRADAVRHLQSDPEANALAQRLVAQLRLLAPKAQLPEIPQARGGRRAAAPPPPPPPEAPQPPGAPPPSAPPPAAGAPSIRERVGGALGSGPSRRQSQIAVGIGAGALLIIVVVLAVSGVFGSSDDDGDGGGGATATATTAANEDLTIVNLGPLGGDSSAQGQAVFARVEDQPVLQINLTGLQQAGKGETYILWLYNSDAVAFPLARDQANQQGNLTGAAAVPQEIVPLLPQFGCIDVSLASSRETAAALQQAAQGQTLPRHSGRSVLRGEIPDAGQQGASGADSNCEVAPPQEGGQSTTPTQ
jgi:Sigma-70, region 4